MNDTLRRKISHDMTVVPEAGETEPARRSPKASHYGHVTSPTCLSRKKRTRIRANVLYDVIADPLTYVRSH